MLARTYKTPAELEITQETFDVLVKTMHMLERGDAKFVADPNLDFGRVNEAKPMFDCKKFNMNYTACVQVKANGDVCGTVACIGGWAAYYAGAKTILAMDHFVSDSHGTTLEELFYPDNNLVYDRCKPKHAVQAIANFLATGDPHWEDIFPDIR